jgi:mRNA interferase MazF
LVTPPAYVPEAGDVVCPAAYNGKSGLMICCPLTTKIKGYPFEVPIAGNPASVVLADQVKSLDWRARRAVRKGRVTAAELVQVRAKLRALVG